MRGWLMESRPKVVDGPGSPVQATDPTGQPLWEVTLAIRPKVRQPVELVVVQIGQPRDPGDILQPGEWVEVLPAILRRVA
ncbi:hypothetical protein [Kutzneria buriramensis]|uniref:Uncharacterized protein n=1 Tax=Kutzneria buriramensis TaxID=1045776 RepID=A0A3E0G5F0_9PSEU|nr:hypothetical protein [Kutzneria buriramensis]REH17430.1 hypothetical protein BCF44_1472 [Kutzneria buriramensis]